MSQQIRYLPGRQRFDRAVRLLDAVDEVGGECVSDRMQTLPLDARRFENAVVASAEVHRARVVAMLVGDERRVLTEVPLCAQVEDRIHGCLIQRHVALARRALELAEPNERKRNLFGCSAFALGALFPSALLADRGADLARVCRSERFGSRGPNRTTMAKLATR